MTANSLCIELFMASGYLLSPFAFCDKNVFIQAESYVCMFECDSTGDLLLFYDRESNYLKIPNPIRYVPST